MKSLDYEHGNITKTIIQSALPMLVAQVLNLLYNIVDRIYIGRIPEIGTVALGAVGLCFPVIIIITAFTNLYGSGGSPLFAIERGKKHDEKAKNIMNTAYWLLTVTSVVLMILIEIFARPILILFGATEQTLPYCLPYIHIYLLGTFFTMIATGMNPYINAQGFPSIGMVSVIIGAVANIILDPIFIFLFDMGVQGAAIATIISQAMSAFFVVHFLRSKKSMYKLEFCLHKEYVSSIVSLGLSNFIMQVTNGLVQIVCNNVLVAYGGYIYVSIFTIVSSVRQMLETPILAIMEGGSPFVSFNYGAKHPKRIIKGSIIMFISVFIYAGLIWACIEKWPQFFICIFSSDPSILTSAKQALHLYFYAFIFMDFQYCGQTIFKCLNKRKYAIFFSLLRKVFIVVPLTLWLPKVLSTPTHGVFVAEPISNVVGGLACFITMLITILPELKKMENERKWV